jgi:hypothetical protein
LVFYVIRGDLNLSRLRALVSSEAVEHAVEDEKVLPDQIPDEPKQAERATVGD